MFEAIIVNVFVFLCNIFAWSFSMYSKEVKG